MFPQGLIDQWLSKPREGRRSVQDDPKATPIILENIHHLEVYCLEHSYEVFCASTLRSPPFALHALGSEDDEKTRLACAPAMFAATEATAGVVGRLADKEERNNAAAAATEHLCSVASRLAAYLQSSSLLLPPQSCSATPNDPPGNSERAARVAQLVVRVIAEAAVAAAVRQGVAAQIATEEQAAIQQQQSRRRLQLRIQSTKTASSHTTATSRGEIEAGYYVAAVPIADYRRAFQGLLSMSSLLRKVRAVPVNGDGDDAPASLLASRKRTRDNDGVAETANLASAEEKRGASTNSWATIREAGLRRLFGEGVPPMPPAVLAAEARKPIDTAATGQASVPLTSAEGWAAMQLQITQRDVLFALQKVCATDAL